MRLFAVVSTLAVALLVGSGCARREEARPPGFFVRSLRWIGLGGAKQQPDLVRTRQLNLAMQIAPEVVKLSEVRLLRVTLQVSNRSRRAVQMQFPTTQRIDVIVRDETGKEITQWSEDQAFDNKAVFLTLNPRERLEYNASVPTRDLEPARRYTIEGFFPRYEELKVQKSITPVP